MNEKGERRIKSTGIVLAIWGLIMTVLSTISIINGYGGLSPITRFIGFLASILSIVSGFLAFRNYNKPKYFTPLLILAIVIVISYFTFSFLNDEIVTSLIGIFLTLMLIGGISLTKRGLKNT